MFRSSQLWRSKVARGIVSKLQLSLIVGSVFFAVIGCGGSDEQAEWMVSEGREGEDASNNEPADPDREDECQSDADCGEDAYCHEPSDCTSPRYCEDGFSPISAAPPIDVCSCDGRVKSANHGYPGRHAWEIGMVGFEVVQGECDPDAEFPVEWSVRVVLPDERPAGLLYRVRWSGEELVRLEPVPDGGILTWEAQGDGWPGFNVRFLLDADGDGTCSEGDEVWMGNIEEQRVDLVSYEMEVALRLDLQSVDRPCDFW